MQTAIHMFKGHPNLPNIKFVVEPMLHEVLHTTCDIHINAMDLIQKFAPGQPTCYGVNFDFSKITSMAQPQLWNISTHANQSKKDLFFERLSQKEGGASYANVKSVMLELMCEELPEGSFETEEEIYQRAQSVKALCK